jgi:hypothetical protein
MDRKYLLPVFFLTLSSASPVSAQTAHQALNYPIRSTTENLAGKRYVAPGDRAYIVGTQDAFFQVWGFTLVDT